MGMDEAIFVEGIGHIAQYHSYLDMYWTHGTPYFVRDYYFNELQEKLAAGAPPKAVRALARRVEVMNNVIWRHEQNLAHSQRTHDGPSASPGPGSGDRSNGDSSKAHGAAGRPESSTPGSSSVRQQ